MHCTVASLTQLSHPRKASASALAVTVTVAVAGPRRISTGQKANPVAWGLDYESFFFTSRLGLSRWWEPNRHMEIPSGYVKIAIENGRL